jgi:hypothetical protein
MSLDLDSRLRVFFASAPQTIWPIQTLQISHSAMTQVFHLWREPYAGTTSDGGAPMAMQPANIEIGLAGSAGHLDQRFTIKLDLVDVLDTFREQMDLVPVDTQEKIVVVYREYLSDDLEEPQATATLQVESISYNIGAALISAVSPRLNILRTGDLYVPKEVPMLRGFL